MRARSAIAWALFGLFARRSRLRRSSSESTSSCLGRPRSAMRTSIVAHKNAIGDQEIPDPPIFLADLQLRTLVATTRTRKVEKCRDGRRPRLRAGNQDRLRIVRLWIAWNMGGFESA